MVRANLAPKTVRSQEGFLPELKRVLRVQVTDELNRGHVLLASFMVGAAVFWVYGAASVGLASPSPRKGAGKSPAKGKSPRKVAPDYAAMPTPQLVAVAR